MASRLSYEVELTISSAKDLKNVNWRHGDLKPYAVAWVDAAAKCLTRVDKMGDTAPVWNEKLTIPLKDRPEKSTLWIDIVHANADEDTKPLIGSARLPLRDILEEVGYGERCSRTLKLKLPSGRPQGQLDVKVTVRKRTYRPPPPPPPPPEPDAYGQGYRKYPTERGYGSGYGYGTAPPSNATAPPARYTYKGSPGYRAPPAYAVPYGADPYNGGSSVAETGKGKKSGYRMGTGLAVGAVAGALGGLAAPPAGYTYEESPGYGAPPAYAVPYGADPYYGGSSVAETGKGKKSGYVMGTGLAVGAVAGALGGLAAPPARYTYGGSPGYGAPPAYAVPYGADPYYGGSSVAGTGKGKKSGYGMGTGLAVGAVAGVLGELALAEGVDYVEEEVEDDLGCDDDDYYGADPYYGGSSVAGTGKGKNSGYGMGTGLAVGAVAGVLGGLALADGVDYVEEEVEDDLGCDDDDYSGDGF